MSVKRYDLENCTIFFTREEVSKGYHNGDNASENAGKINFEQI